MDDNKYDEQLGDMAEEDNSVPDIENNENTLDIEDNENTPDVEDDDYTPEVKDNENTPDVEDDDYTPEVVDDDDTPDVEDENKEADAEDKDVTVDDPVLSGRKRKKKKRTGLILFLLVLILAAGGAVGYYMYLRTQPQEAVEEYLSAVQRLDFTAMEGMLQSNDLSALDDADLRNEAYTEFFKSINEKMTFKIIRNDFSLNNGTARITARIHYIDGTEIYKETVIEFLRQIASKALSGESPTQEDAQTQLASILCEKVKTTTPVYSETDILYPVIKTYDTWKIVSLDDATVKLMSANVKNIENEINQTLDGSVQNTSDDPAASGTDGSQTASIDMTTTNFQIRYTRHQTTNDYAGNPCLLVYYDYTNLSSVPSSAMVDVSLSAYQNDTVLSAAIPDTNDDALDHYMAEIQPGETVSVCQAFSLNDTSDVTLVAGEGLSFGGGATTSQILKLQ